MLIIGISGKSLTSIERSWVICPQVSGVILFTRNFEHRQQITRLIDDIRTLRSDPFLICVDQEGGPVQRFRDGFTALPALARIGALYERDPRQAIALAEEHAWLMASEMSAIGVDLSFAPVVDLARGNRAIGERAFHTDVGIVSILTQAYLRGMRLAGMAATLKHFPGHGSVLEDTHFDAATDPRTLETIRTTDLVPFIEGIAVGAEAVMMAHVTYPAVDAYPAGYSHVWIHDILRNEMGFHGVVLSDDIGMAAAESAGGLAARIHAHLQAGCDLVLVCNPSLVPEALLATQNITPVDPHCIIALQNTATHSWDALVDNPQRNEFSARLSTLENT